MMDNPGCKPSQNLNRPNNTESTKHNIGTATAPHHDHNAAYDTVEATNPPRTDSAGR